MKLSFLFFGCGPNPNWKPVKHPGYGMKGNLFGIGYIKGIMDTLHIKYE